MQKSRHLIFDDHFLYSHNLDIGAQKVKGGDAIPQEHLEELRQLIKLTAFHYNYIVKFCLFFSSFAFSDVNKCIPGL